jgi:hypothetical protein
MEGLVVAKESGKQVGWTAWSKAVNGSSPARVGSSQKLVATKPTRSRARRRTVERQYVAIDPTAPEAGGDAGGFVEQGPGVEDLEDLGVGPADHAEVVARQSGQELGEAARPRRVHPLGKPFKTELSEADYKAVRDLGDEYFSRNPRSID